MLKMIKTSDYSLFVFKKGNRPVNARVASLARAIKGNNELERYPILCSRLPNGKYEIADGQHRFAAAERLGVPVTVIVSEDQVTIEEIAGANAQQRAWSLRDWLYSWVARGHSEYLKLKNYCDQNDIAVSMALEVIGQATAGSGDSIDCFKRGTFKFTDEKFAKLYATVLSGLKAYLNVKASRFGRALIRVLRVKGLDSHRLVRKLIKHKSQFVTQFAWPDYVRLFEKIYNYKAKPDDLFYFASEVERVERERMSKKRKKSATSFKKAA